MNSKHRQIAEAFADGYRTKRCSCCGYFFLGVMVGAIICMYLDYFKGL